MYLDKTLVINDNSVSYTLSMRLIAFHYAVEGEAQKLVNASFIKLTKIDVYVSGYRFLHSIISVHNRFSSFFSLIVVMKKESLQTLFTSGCPNG